ncbi:reverse transcriptase domain-containing protein [Seleniivibrio woodruffii]|uniref:Retron-type reverse transcriptase n=1 Tax=Seleniivibrio woodruffii TaxID=1078050 RepID=A0A4R1K2V9_9BACT|nr:reverse transcriptase domain-containing protein [Seleniivibrio woodruffii]TCK58388.1 retron-type reverse transcriptase [Seleniivibrio woodruffii]TVZ36761.1 retron-type reverse transcriptase [Seleniivibrio woodruffii]
MKASELFKKSFKKENIIHVYNEHIRHSTTIGLDRVSIRTFEKNLDEHIDVIQRKCLNGQYVFTKYKLLLISKGPDKYPRKISIPTIRDRIVLKVLQIFISQVFKDSLNITLPQTTISHLKDAITSGMYTHVIRTDITNYYPSINHKILFKIIHSKIKKKEATSLIKKAICTCSVTKSNKLNNVEEQCGVPQGLSISNILAALYLHNFDQKFQNNQEMAYFRYVDDILVLSNDTNKDLIANTIQTLLKRDNKLKIHDFNKSDKSSISLINEPFNFLGYVFNSDMVTVKSTAKEKLIESLIKILTQYNYSREKRKEIVEWRLNLRISGCIFDKTRRGWVFYYSQVNDETMLHQLDYLVKKLLVRYELVGKISVKSFVRTYHEIIKNFHNTNYIPNFDKYTNEQMVKTLKEYFPRKFNQATLSSMTPIEIEKNFRRQIGYIIKDIEQDIKPESY